MLNLPNIFQNYNILICAIGGGFDIFGAIPLVFSLPGNKVFLSSYNLNKFNEPLYNFDGKGSEQFPYFPELILIQNKGLPQLNVVGKLGVEPLKRYYQKLIDQYQIQMLVTVDCGVDSLMKGDEAYKGTITEEYVNFAAIKDLNVKKIHVCFGFGTEKEENISHYRVLENIAELTRNDGFLGTCSLTKNSNSFKVYKNTYNLVNNYPEHKKSHIHPRIISAIEGEFGLKSSSDKTLMASNQDVFISPLMGMYWFFDGKKVIDSIKCLNDLTNDRLFVQSTIKINELPKLRDNQPILY
jgi:hypothetical protein